MASKIAHLLILALCVATPAVALDAGDYLPESVRYDPTVPTPASYLGFEVGEWHVRHDQLVGYLELLAERSPRVAIERTGKTHEQRPLLLLTVSSPDNIAAIDTIRDNRQSNPQQEDGPLVVWQGFSVHGNEASGSNASMLLAYHLAAAQDDKTRALLDDTVVLIDPSLNPDGFSRFAQWANSHKALAPTADPNARVHHEVWPNGRTNHYWFDLNRDWLLLVHPESRARVAQYHRWHPHVLTDFHEMGSDGTYFFQPGVPSRANPLTPQRNVELTKKIGNYHAAALENLGQLFFTEEVFDDYYFGKGSTYPDINGAIGILFEQASARGQVIDTPHGELDFPTTIRNQLATSLSTLDAAHALHDELIEYQREFYDQAAQRAAQDPVGAYVFGDGGDPARARVLIDTLQRHDIDVHELKQPIEIDGVDYTPGAAWIVPTAQHQYLLVHALMERRTEFADDTFYDVSTWTLPLSLDLPSATVARAKSKAVTGDLLATLPPAAGYFEPTGDAYAYAFDWTDYYAPRALERLLAADRRVYVATKPFTASTPDGKHGFGRGSVVVPAARDDHPAELERILRTAANTDGIDIRVLTGGLTPDGIDLGSPSLRRVEPVRPLLVVGRGVSGYEAGQAWHLLDTRVGLPLTMVDTDRLGDVDLHDYTDLILVDGRYGALGDDEVERLDDWVRTGGHLIAIKRGAKWALDHGLLEPKKPGAKNDESKADADKSKPDETQADKQADEKPTDEPDKETTRPYAAFRDDRARRQIAGAIFEVALDTTHPVGYGYVDDRLPVFRNGTVILDPSDNPYENVALYTDAPLLSGYVGEQRLEQLAGSAAVVARRVGRGSVVLLADDPNFRGIWYGTNRLFVNAVFLSQIIDATKLDD